MSAPAPRFEVLDGGRSSLSAAQAKALRRLVSVLRGLPDEQAAAAATLLEEISLEDGLKGLREIDLGVLRILAEVLKGWEVDGVHEFGRAWVSTLVSRRDGFAWDRSTAAEREMHRRDIEAEMIRRRL
jgi:hypothetical protein